MKFGLCLPIRRDCSIEFNIELAKKAEKLGYDSVWVSDHVLIPERVKGSFSTVFYDPFVLLSAIATQTDTIKLGTSVIILPYRNPIVVAKMITTIDMLSRGRVIMGVAAGWLKEEFDCLNAEFENRGKVSDEYIKAIKELCENDSPEFHGQYTEFSDINFYPKLFENRKPDIWIGGSGKRVIERAVELGTGWQPTWINPAEYKEYCTLIRNSASEKSIGLEGFTFSVRNRVRLEEPGGKIDNSGDPSYIFKGTVREIEDEVKKFEKSGADYIVFDPEADDEEGILRVTEQISEIITKNR